MPYKPKATTERRPTFKTRPTSVACYIILVIWMSTCQIPRELKGSELTGALMNNWFLTSG